MEVDFSDNEDEELERLRLLREAEESGDHSRKGEANAAILRTLSSNELEPEEPFAPSSNERAVPKSAFSAGKSSKALPQSSELDRKTVSTLLKQKRHKETIVVSPTLSVIELAKKLCQERKNAALIRDDVSRKIIGIITDADICKRVVAKSKSCSTVTVAEVMTSNPVFANPNTNILDIFAVMTKNRFRHLPVLDDQKETVYGLVDIAQCLYDVIQKIDLAQKKEVDFMHTVQRAHLRWNSNDGDQAGITAVLAQEIINDMIQKICPKVAIILSSNEKTLGTSLLLSPKDTVQRAAEIMASLGKTAVLGVESSGTKGHFGIFTTKDLLSKVVAKALDPKQITLEEVMTRNPDTVDSETSLVEALHCMHDGRFLHVPVVCTDIETDEEKVVGILDVLDCAVHTLSRFNKAENSTKDVSHDIYNAKTNPEAEREMFTALFLKDDLSDSGREERNSSFNASHVLNPTVNIHDSISQAGNEKTDIPLLSAVASVPTINSFATLQLKVKNCIDGKTYRTEFDFMKGTQYEKFIGRIMNVAFTTQVEPTMLSFFYLDEDQDEISLHSEECLKSAVDLAKSVKTDKMTVVIKKVQNSPNIKLDTMIPFAIFGVGAVLVIGTLLWLTSANSSAQRSASRFSEGNHYTTYGNYK